MQATARIAAPRERIKFNPGKSKVKRHTSFHVAAEEPVGNHHTDPPNQHLTLDVHIRQCDLQECNSNNASTPTTALGLYLPLDHTHITYNPNPTSISTLLLDPPPPIRPPSSTPKRVLRRPVRPSLAPHTHQMEANPHRPRHRLPRSIPILPHPRTRASKAGRGMAA